MAHDLLTFGFRNRVLVLGLPNVMPPKFLSCWKVCLVALMLLRKAVVPSKSRVREIVTLLSVRINLCKKPMRSNLSCKRRLTSTPKESRHNHGAFLQTMPAIHGTENKRVGDRLGSINSHSGMYFVCVAFILVSHTFVSGPVT